MNSLKNQPLKNLLGRIGKPQFCYRNVETLRVGWTLHLLLFLSLITHWRWSALSSMSDNKTNVKSNYTRGINRS